VQRRIAARKGCPVQETEFDTTLKQLRTTVAKTTPDELLRGGAPGPLHELVDSGSQQVRGEASLCLANLCQKVHSLLEENVSVVRRVRRSEMDVALSDRTA
jgi:hypothetical protein